MARRLVRPIIEEIGIAMKRQVSSPPMWVGSWSHIGANSSAGGIETSLAIRGAAEGRPRSAASGSR